MFTSGFADNTPITGVSSHLLINISPFPAIRLTSTGNRNILLKSDRTIWGGTVIASDELLNRIAEVLKAMADPTRLKILHSLHNGERCVSDILEVVGGSQANVSKHLSVLKRAGLVDCRRSGLNVYYRIIDEGVFTICRNVCDSLESRADHDRQTILRGRREVMELETGKKVKA
jgi:DNA-binding transcriptional ArsR family regulator